MKQRLFQLRSFVTYWLNAVDEHSIHSPFFYNFYTRIVKAAREKHGIEQIETLRNELLNDNAVIDVVDLGAGSKHFRNVTRKVSDIARISLSSRKYSMLYKDIIEYFNAGYIIELGTSLGINTLYLASATQGSVQTLEGSEALANIAQGMFARLKASNISIIRGNINDTLAGVISSLPQIDFAFFDANHRYEPTIGYFESMLSKVTHDTILVMDDIHDSSEMERAWRYIKKHNAVHASADLYRCGIVFFNPSLNRQHFVLQI